MLGDPEVDVEAGAGASSREEYRDSEVFELQPRLSLPLYYEPPADDDLEEDNESSSQ